MTTIINKVGIIEKGWGYEEIWASTPYYCGKFMHFRQGAQFSMHFHRTKRESWYCMSGQFDVEFIDTSNAKKYTRQLKSGDTWTNDILVPHRLICTEEGTIIEVSTADDPKDNYRVLPGDSQKEI